MRGKPFEKLLEKISSQGVKDFAQLDLSFIFV